MMDTHFLLAAVLVFLGAVGLTVEKARQPQNRAMWGVAAILSAGTGIMIALFHASILVR